jgi:hypothetical protein
MKVLLGMFLSLGLAGIASADSVWTYTGNVMNGADGANQFTGCDCSLSGSLTLSDTFQPISWNFTDGVHSLDSSDSTISFDTSLPSQPGSPALFHHWDLDILGSGLEFFSEFNSIPEYAVDRVGVNGVTFGLEGGNHGTWVDPVTTAEPATGLLVGLSLAIAGLMRRRKKKPLESTVWENLA